MGPGGLAEACCEPYNETQIYYFDDFQTSHSNLHSQSSKTYSKHSVFPYRMEQAKSHLPESFMN